MYKVILATKDPKHTSQQEEKMWWYLETLNNSYVFLRDLEWQEKKYTYRDVWHMIRLYAQSNIKYYFRFSNMSLNQFFTAINTTICNRDCMSHMSLYPCLGFLILFIYFQWNFTGICNIFRSLVRYFCN